MKSKIAFLIFAVNCCIIKPAYGDSSIYTPEPFAEDSSSNFDCDARDGYRYVSFGVGPIIVIPNAGIGYRTRYSQIGWDAALSFSTIGYVHQISAHLVSHYYLSSLRKNSAYLGLGLMGSFIFTNYKEGLGTLSPDFVFGKELERSGDSRHFIEMHVAIPTMLANKHPQLMYLPLMYIKYGISF